MRLLQTVTVFTALTALAQAADSQFDAGTEIAPVADAGVVEHNVPLTAPFANPPKHEDKTVETTARFGEGVTFKAKGLSLNLRSRIQTQALAVFPTAESTAQRQSSLMIRRARLAIKGELPWHLSFTLQLAFSNLDMEPDAPNVLRDAYIDFRPLRALSVRFGQMKVPFDVQRVISSSSLQMVDRSIVTGELNLDRDVGVLLYSDDLFDWRQRLRYTVGIMGGDGRNRIGANQGLLYVARVRFSFFGPFDDKIEGDPDRLDELRLAIGGAVARNVLTNRPRSTLGTPYQVATFDYTHATADLHVKWRGASLLSQFFWRQADQNFFDGSLRGMTLKEFSRSGLGWFVQAGYYALPWLEFTGRYGDLRPTAATDPTFKRQREIGGGLNFMFQKHDFKIQSDYFWLDDGASGNGRHQIRVQAQVFF